MRRQLRRLFRPQALSSAGSVDAGTLQPPELQPLRQTSFRQHRPLPDDLVSLPCGIAASLVVPAASFPTLYGSAEAALGSIAQTPGGVATRAFGGMGIVEPLSGPGFWVPVAGGLVLNLDKDGLPQTVIARENLIRHSLTSLFTLRVPETSGGTSLMENLSTQVQERWGNPQWLVSLHTLHPTTLRREIAMEKSLKEEIRYLRMLSKQHREALLVIIAGERTEE